MPLRLWVAGCATGEEAYSLAILLHELMAKLGERPVKIFATDVHRGSLEQATRGLYDDEAVADVSAERLARYFIRSGDTYQVVPELRQMVVFAQHNVIKDAPFTRVDLITCRNLLIYLQPPAQQKVLSLFHFALNRGGVLFSRAERERRRRWRASSRPSTSTGASTASTATRACPSTRAFRPSRRPTRASPCRRAAAGGRHSLSQLLGTYDALLERVMPPSLLVSERGELIHAFARRCAPARPRAAGNASPASTPGSSPTGHGCAVPGGQDDKSPVTRICRAPDYAEPMVVAPQTARCGVVFGII